MSAKHHRNLPTTFLTQLPFDILNKIFSQLKQRDCIACVGVCHEWYNHVPQYITHIWESVTLSQRHLDAVLDASHSKSTMCCLKRCLGSHVKHVELVGFEYELDLYWMMQNLIDWSCDQIQTLALTHFTYKPADSAVLVAAIHNQEPHVDETLIMMSDNSSTRSGSGSEAVCEQQPRSSTKTFC
ncbi:hypothetical protein BDB00DRAFT_789069 [Zychaea mexicana]|uniref:uncharacterized protein n=1 Tax=Zychaea mexicana TaxID=64656 RepID=UPI0022FF1251|nr:uncharacterized protein BDB00DRAFT_789069 [Zychaea mexicana]KAI9492115.1 hypothetical protein BDB00DRAFT_789069 [Zychaea mexicana]